MSAPPLIDALTAYHRETLAVAESLPEQALRQQYHPQLSPLGWHIGHCAFIETLWVQGELLGNPHEIRRWRALYQPELAYKPGRGQRLPGRAALTDWCRARHRENRAVLADPPATVRASALLQENYLHHFLLQHYAQHLETMDYIQAQRHGATYAAPEDPGLTAGWVDLPPGRFAVGCASVAAYDNEQERHWVSLPGARLAATPVSNGQFAAFMADRGYQRRELWDAEGWQWRCRHQVVAPGYWSAGADGHPARPGAPVRGVSHYEAQAYARWAGARLPHEFEWEAACRQGLLSGAGQVWEWCANAFHPYPGFLPFPYAGYSLAWYDGAHYVLRGASTATRAAVRRPSFRNFYTRDVRHVFAGLRLALPIAHKSPLSKSARH